MYVPPLGAILKAIGVSREEFERFDKVEVPTALLRFLIQLSLINSDFNEEGYLGANQDVATAVNNGAIENPRLHYIGDGYFEGRLGGMPDVDERWYLRTYSDVAAAVRAGKIASAAKHFELVGAFELRAPSAAYEPDAVQWGRALGR